ncbi:hypothetical protein [Lacrimispora sp.]|uniref:hypothetical protein n=1 Tax=Lacrimispora sp. TaxID=2719234 RepID=UPI0028968DB6|nr:hypothetical protein [Lacrimispora sp.]
MLTLTIVMMNSGTVLDIMVKPEQRIRDVLEVLAENGQIRYQSGKETISARSWRLGSFVNSFLTFKQAKIQTEDIIYIEVMGI